MNTHDLINKAAQLGYLITDIIPGAPHPVTIYPDPTRPYTPPVVESHQAPWRIHTIAYGAFTPDQLTAVLDGYQRATAMATILTNLDPQALDEYHAP